MVINRTTGPGNFPRDDWATSETRRDGNPRENPTETEIINYQNINNYIFRTNSIFC